MKEGEGMSQRMFMCSPQTQTAVWWWPEEEGTGAGGGGQGRGNGDICNSVNRTMGKKL